VGHRSFQYNTFLNDIRVTLHILAVLRNFRNPNRLFSNELRIFNLRFSLRDNRAREMRQGFPGPTDRIFAMEKHSSLCVTIFYFFCLDSNQIGIYNNNSIPALIIKTYFQTNEKQTIRRRGISQADHPDIQFLRPQRQRVLDPQRIAVIDGPHQRVHWSAKSRRRNI
jgi:hypothetical protein